MATVTAPISAFEALRDHRRHMAIPVRLITRLATWAAGDPELARVSLECAATLKAMLQRVAEAEERLVFPCLSRWLEQSQDGVQRSRAERQSLKHAIDEFYLDVRLLLVQRNVSNARRVMVGSRALAKQFEGWAITQEREIFALGDLSLGQFATAVLAGRVQLALSARAPTPAS